MVSALVLLARLIPYFMLETPNFLEISRGICTEMSSDVVYLQMKPSFSKKNA